MLEQKVAPPDSKPGKVMSQGKSVADVPLPDFDLHNVEAALRENHRLFGGVPLTEKEIAASIQQYREFLRDHKRRGTPDNFLVPPRNVDRVWHTHMCETRQYADDCISYFGEMFHHSAGLCDQHPHPTRYVA